MGIRGPKPGAGVRDRNRRIWRTYLLVAALGYWRDRCPHREVARRTGVSYVIVHDVLHKTNPEGCYT